MITLVLVRHAKSEWGEPGLPDHDRPLNERGMRDAPVMAQRLAATGFRPDVLLASTAVRAQATAAAFAAALGVTVEPRDDLYGASANTLIQAAADTGAARVLIVAHDPGLSILADSLSNGAVTHMPTCAVATFTWDNDDWEIAAALPADRWEFDAPAK